MNSRAVAAAMVVEVLVRQRRRRRCRDLRFGGPGHRPSGFGQVSFARLDPDGGEKVIGVNDIGNKKELHSPSSCRPRSSKENGLF